MEDHSKKIGSSQRPTTRPAVTPPRPAGNVLTVSGPNRLATGPNDRSWLLDSRASCHVCGQLSLMDSGYELGDNLGYIYLEGKVPVQILGIGTVTLGNTLKLNDVRYVQAGLRNLISIGQLVGEGYGVCIGSGSWEVMKDGVIVLQGDSGTGLPLYTQD